MGYFVTFGLLTCWFTIIFYWAILITKAKKVAEQERKWVQFFYYYFPLLIAVLLLGPNEFFAKGILSKKLVQNTTFISLLGLFISIAGTIVACFARYKLGRNWSLSVQKKEKHELVQSGIYSIIRHPIYTGLLLLFTGNAIVIGSFRGLIAVIIVFISFWIKLLKEEKLLCNLFGASFIQYKKNTKALIPFIL